MKTWLTLLCFCVTTSIFSQYCISKDMTPAEPFHYSSEFANVELHWYQEWLDHTNGEKILPKPLKPQEKWLHPYMKQGYTAAMHEGPWASDVSNMEGPTIKNPRVQYFHVKQKKGDFSGMCPTFAFINDTTLVTLSFGRANTTLLLLDVKDTIRVLDQLPIPGRGSSAFELAGKKARRKIFSNTAGGAYSYISNKNRIYIPGANNNILRVTIKDRKLVHEVESLDLKEPIEAGNLMAPELSEKDKLNQLTAIMPDVNGNIWFTSRQGVLGLIHRTDETAKGCPSIYASWVGFFGLKEKIQKHFPNSLDVAEKILNSEAQDSLTPEMRQERRTLLKIDEDTYEEIQNSFSVGKDGVYIVSNAALFKFFFNEDTKQIEMDPKWAETFKKGDLVYDNDLLRKPGHLNKGSGTTPTLMDDRFVAICDNAPGRVNLCIYRQDNGELVSKLPLFENNGSAVENSTVAYGNTYIVANTYGYTDPFKVNPTPGGIMRFDYNESTGKFEKVEGWPESGNYDCKTATPKISTKTGMIYVYNRDENETNGHHDWQFTTIDYETGLRVFSTKLFFDKGGFKDNIGFILRAGSLGNKNYDRKVFNNIWGTFTFGPDKSIYLGTYRGFIKLTSD